jgi:DNA-binding NarL/FixJ family response regulator
MDIGEHPRPGTVLSVAVVDDHEVVRNGLKAILDAAPDLTVVAEAGTAEEAVAEAERTAPDVVVMDVRLPDGSGIEATREIRARRERTRVLMLTSFPESEAMLASILAGASGFVLKHVRMDELVDAVRAVGRGESLIEPVEKDMLIDRLNGGTRSLRGTKLARLSPQEREILEMIALGLTNRQIGVELGLAEKTVKNYASTVLSKLEMARRSEAATYLIRNTRSADR